MHSCGRAMRNLFCCKTGTNKLEGMTIRGVVSSTSPLMEEYVTGYDNFWQKIKQVENDPLKQPLIVIFRANEITQGLTWCPDCNDFEDRLRTLRQQHTPLGYHLRVSVGYKAEWKDLKNPFRLDSRLRIESVPTLIAWHSGIRISGHETTDLEKLRVFFMEKQ